MHLHHHVPVGFAGVGEGLVAQNAGVVHQDVDLAEAVDRRLEDRLAAFHGRDVGAIGHRLAAIGDDLVHHGLGHRRGPRRGAVARAAEVIDDHRCAFLGEQFGVGAAQPAASPGDDRHLSIEQAHRFLLQVYPVIGAGLNDTV